MAEQRAAVAEGATVRIANAAIAEIKARLDIVEVISRYCTLHRAGHRFRGLCPFHDERSPSLLVNPDTGHFYCFGCTTGGDVIGFLQKREERPFLDVVRELAAQVGVDLERPENTVPASAPRPRTPAPRPDPEPVSLSPAAAAVVEQLLELCPVRKEPDVLTYLRGRGLEHEAHALGALPRDRRALDALHARLVVEHGEDAVAAAGLTNKPEEGGHFWPVPYAQNRLVIPWRGPGLEAPIVTCQRRRLDGEKRNRYVNPTGIGFAHPFGIGEALELMGAGTELSIVEGALDTLAIREVWRRCEVEARVAIGIPSACKWRPSWARYAAGCSIVRIALDADAAGERLVECIEADIRGAAPNAAIERSTPTGAKDWGDALVRLTTETA